MLSMGYGMSLAAVMSGGTKCGLAATCVFVPASAMQTSKRTTNFPTKFCLLGPYLPSNREWMPPQPRSSQMRREIVRKHKRESSDSASILRLAHSAGNCG